MRIFLLVIDSFGVGALPDASTYGDEGANTAAGIGKAVGGVHWPNLQKMGLGNAAALVNCEIIGCPPESEPTAQFAAMCEKSPGKDTTTGHWELAGIELSHPFHVFPGQYPSFPESLIKDFISEGQIPGILGNKAASGTQIIEELGEQHLQSACPICYTSADSVFQIATHVDVVPLNRLYELCEIARKLCNPYRVGRIIARPFEGKPGHFLRTRDRHDWSIDLPGKTLLDYLQDQNVQTVAVGKIGSIFNEQGIDVSHHDAGNPACIKRTLMIADEQYPKDQFVFVNLVDTDMIYGHRRDAVGYHDAVAEIDKSLPLLIDKLSTGDILIVTADHGCDPTFKGTDHTREYVPLLFQRIGEKPKSASLGIRERFTDLSASIQGSFGLPVRGLGKSFV